MQIILYIWVSLFFLLYQSFDKEDLVVMSYNIRYDNKADTGNNWNQRKAAMITQINDHDADLIGMQEVLYHQLEYLNSNLVKYAWVGVGRDDGKTKGEYSPIFFDSTRLVLQRQGTFWLSAKSDTISVGWDAAMERICTYALLEEKHGKNKFWVFNTHFDHRGEKAREMSARLILQKISELNQENMPVVLCGDLNCLPESQPIKIIKEQLNDGLEISASPPAGPKETFNGFKRKPKLKNRIDYIFVSGFTVMSYAHLDERMENQKWISDHLPVLAKLDFQ